MTGKLSGGRAQKALPNAAYWFAAGPWGKGLRAHGVLLVLAGAKGSADAGFRHLSPAGALGEKILDAGRRFPACRNIPG